MYAVYLVTSPGLAAAFLMLRARQRKTAAAPRDYI